MAHTHFWELFHLISVILHKNDNSEESEKIQKVKRRKAESNNIWPHIGQPHALQVRYRLLETDLKCIINEPNVKKITL